MKSNHKKNSFVHRHLLITFIVAIKNNTFYMEKNVQSTKSEK